MRLAHPTSADRRSLATRERAEAGFSLIELIVVMIIIAILIAAIVPQFSSAKSTARLKEARAAAGAYGDAIEAFQLSHASRPPEMGRAEEWARTTGCAINVGPVDLQRRPLMKEGVPDAVRRGLVSVGDGAPGCATAFGHVRYIAAAGGTNSWRLEVYYRRTTSTAWPSAPNCYIGPAALAGSGVC